VPTITVKEGDFGTDVEAMVGAGDIYLPDPRRPGLTTPVPLTEVEEIESDEIDGLRPVKDALSLGAMAIFGGGPGALADGFSSVTKVKDVVFNVALRDGRRFVAVANAKVYADLRSAHLEARRETRAGASGGDTPDSADDIIARYVNAANPPSTVAAPEAIEPPPAAPDPEPPPKPSRPAAAAPERPAFGRRGVAR
jgi:hypothetical protein